jgi:hypothetical protein
MSAILYSSSLRLALRIPIILHQTGGRGAGHAAAAEPSAA